MTQKFDAVVIGSGFGGAITAYRLAERGMSVCVLERGRHWKPDEFPRDLWSLPGHGGVIDGMWSLKHRRYGYFEYRFFPDIEIIQGSAVGGGSVHYYGAHLRADADIFQSRWPTEITRAELDPYYDRAEAMFGLETVGLAPTNSGLPSPPTRSRAFHEVVRRAGGNANYIPLNIHFSGEDSDDKCDHAGHCLLGCHRARGKQSLDKNYLSSFLTRLPNPKRQLWPLCLVDRIEPLGDELGKNGYRVHFERLQDSGPHDADHVDAQRVIVAAGTLGTNGILLRSQERQLRHLSQKLGATFSGNGDYLYSGTLLDRDVRPTKGPAITSMAAFQVDGFKLTLQDCSISEVLDGLLTLTALRAQTEFEVARSTVKNLFSDDAHRPMNIESLLEAAMTPLLSILASSQLSWVKNLLTGVKPADNLLSYLIMGEDAADGRIVLDGNDVEVQWDNSASRPLYRAMNKLVRQLAHANNAYPRYSLWEQSAFQPLLTAHPLGGCVLANDPDYGVVNHLGQPFAADAQHVYENLYVADGSLIPTSLRVNPSHTISALAERIAAHIV